MEITETFFYTFMLTCCRRKYYTIDRAKSQNADTNVVFTYSSIDKTTVCFT